MSIYPVNHEICDKCSFRITTNIYDKNGNELPLEKWSSVCALYREAQCAEEHIKNQGEY